MNDKILTIKKSTLVDIANEVRAKTGSTDLIKVADLDDAVANIQGGGSDIPSAGHEVFIADELSENYTVKYSIDLGKTWNVVDKDNNNLSFVTESGLSNVDGSNVADVVLINITGSEYLNNTVCVKVLEIVDGKRNELLNYDYNMTIAFVDDSEMVYCIPVNGPNIGLFVYDNTPS